MTNDKSKKPKKDKTGYGIGIGIALGVAFGVAVDNMGLGIALGVCLGAAYDVTQAKKATKKDKDDTDI